MCEMLLGWFWKMKLKVAEFVYMAFSTRVKLLAMIASES